MTGDDEITKYWENAQKTLSNAQAICQTSQNTIANVQQKVSEWQKIISKMQFTFGCIRTQTKSLADGILREMIGSRLLGGDWEKAVLDSLFKSMQQSKEDMLSKFDELSNSRNVLGNEGATLLDFISTDNVNILNERFNDLNVINVQVASIKSQYQSLMDKVINQLLNTRVRRLEQEYNSFFGSGSTDFIVYSEKSISSLNALEEELVDVLKSLTDHYDNCVLLKLNKIPEEESKELLKVVTKDNEELDSIMGVLDDAVAEIEEIAKDIYAKAQQKEKEKRQVKICMEKVVSDLVKYEEYLTVFEGIYELITSFKKSCMEDIDKVRELCVFYENFLNSYKHLLQEVERRRSLAKQMRSIIQNCEEKLHQLTISDLKKRQMFLVEHGDYLPENIWPNNIEDLEPLYTLKYNIKKI